MIHRSFLMIYLSVFCVLHSCGDANKKTGGKVDIRSRQFQDQLIEANKMYVKKESDEIDQYVARRGWKMITTGTGLRYMITRKGTGPSAKLEGGYDTYATLRYKISLLDGTECYSSDKDGPKEFYIGHDNIEAGIHEGVQYLNEGDKAIMILPSHLAHGLIGDQARIPPKSSVLYELELVSLRKTAKAKRN